MLLVKVTDNDMSQCMHLPFSICSKTEKQGIKDIPVWYSTVQDLENPGTLSLASLTPQLQLRAVQISGFCVIAVYFGLDGRCMCMV